MIILIEMTEEHTPRRRSTRIAGMPAAVPAPEEVVHSVLFYFIFFQ